MKKLILILLSVLLLFIFVNITYAQETTTEEQPAPEQPEIVCEDYVCPNGTIAECFIDEESICTCKTCPVEEEPVEVVCEDYTCNDGTTAECYLDESICTCEVCEAEDTAVCKDSDGGKNYYVAGEVTASNSHLTYEDRCAYGQAGNPDTMNDPNLLFEAHCFEKEFGYGYDYYSCPNGCKNGACVKEERECPIGCVCTENTITCGAGNITAEIESGIPTAEECPVGCECEEGRVICEAVEIPEKNNCYMGCRLSDKCVIQGTRASINDIGSYCSIEGKWSNQKGTKESCQNNYECKTNFCSNNVCVDISGELKETRGILKRIVDFLSKLFGFK